MPDLNGKRVAILATDGFEWPELNQPRTELQGAGATCTILSLKTGSIRGFNDDIDPAGEVKVDQAVKDADPADFDALVVPGGTVNADRLRADDDAVDFVRRFAATNKPMSVICHAPWVLVAAGLAEGRSLTSFSSLKDDLTNAGATWRDEEVVIDGALITSRDPDDLDAFCRETIKAIAA